MTLARLQHCVKNPLQYMNVPFEMFHQPLIKVVSNVDARGIRGRARTECSSVNLRTFKWGCNSVTAQEWPSNKSTV